MSDTKTISTGPGFLGLLTIVFVVLKATGHLDWSWWLVFSPIWGPLAIVFVLWAAAGAFLGAAHLYDKHRARKRQRERRR